MTSRPLLERQASLIACLTSGATIFGDGGDAPDPTLHGIDRAALHLEARLSHDKRMGNIAAILPKTFAILRRSRNLIVRAFAETCPPVGNGRMENARQFRDFLFSRAADAPAEPAYLRDLAAFEFACATSQIRSGVPVLPSEKAGTKSPDWFRRRSEVVLLRCEYDLRAIFEDGSDGAPRRAMALAIRFPQGAASPQIFELPPVDFDMLTRMDDWTDTATLGDAPELKDLLGNLAQHELIESRIMRICIIGKFPPIQGGVSAQTYWSAHALARRGHDVHVVTNAKEAVAPYRMHDAGGGLGSLRGHLWRRFGERAMDRPGRSIASAYTRSTARL